MITINTDKGLVKVGSWEEILERPGFTDNLDPKQHELRAIIGRYMFGDKVRCGLSDCRTPHTRGYLVSTKDGRETNIGKDCGSKYFGVDFEEQARQFERDIAAKDNRELLWSVRFGLDELETKITVIRAGSDGADWVNKNVTALQNPAKTPVEITRKFADFIRQKNGRLTSQRLATKQETENLEALQGRKLQRPHYLEEPVAEVKGIEALYPENSLQQLLVVKLEENIKDFKTKNIDTLSAKDLTHWSKWSQSISQTLEVAYAAVGYGRLLLTQKNLRLLSEFGGVANPEDRERFTAFISTLPV